MKRPWLVLLPWLLAACGRAPAPASQAETPAQAQKPSPEPSDAAGPAAAERDEAYEAHEAAPEDDQPAERKKDALGAAQKSGAPESATADLARLDAEEAEFEDALSPTVLSCGGALPRREAICTLAARICDLAHEEPTASGRKHAAEDDCKKASASCDKAKKIYAQSCGS